MIFSDEVSTIAFYGISMNAVDLANYYHTVVDWFGALGFAPDKLAVDGPGHSGKWVSFPRADAKLRKNGFAGVTTLDITSMTPGGQIPVTDYVLTASMIISYSVLAVACRSSVATLSGESMLPLARTLAETAKPEYGIGYRREQKMGPAFYAIGICQGLGFSDAEREEGRRISRWCDTGMKMRVYSDGILRDVYPWNFLNASQRSALVDGVSFEEWIKRDPARGKLAPFARDLVLWKVDEPNLLGVRDSLQDTGLIFDWRKHIGR